MTDAFDHFLGLSKIIARRLPICDWTTLAPQRGQTPAGTLSMTTSFPRIQKSCLIRLSPSFASLTPIKQQRSKLFQNFICGFLRQFADELGFSNAPIEVFHLVGKNDSS